MESLASGLSNSNSIRSVLAKYLQSSFIKSAIGVIPFLKFLIYASKLRILKKGKPCQRIL
jgi:hypothetical protein